MKLQTRKLTEFDVLGLLEQRYSGDEWAFFRQLRNGTGFTATRTIDAVAMNLWPSRGLEIHGIEVKTARNDWLRELKNPSKAEEVAAYCDRWWIAVGDRDLVKDGELPSGWGLLAPRGGKMTMIVEAPLKKRREPDRAWWASIIRASKQYVEPDKETRAKLVAQYEAGLKEGQTRAQYSRENAAKELERVNHRINEFERVSGVKIGHWDYGKVGEALKVFMEIKDKESYAHKLREMSDVLASEAVRLRDSADDMLKRVM